MLHKERPGEGDKRALEDGHGVNMCFVWIKHDIPGEISLGVLRRRGDEENNVRGDIKQ